MSISFRILGKAGGDNALLVQIDSGQTIERLLFDCGEGCLSDVPFADVQAIDHLFFSHLHMDHVSGFDSFFRCTFNRPTKPNRIWGPPETARILQHRFQGFLWNLHEELSASWLVSDIHPGEIRTTGFEAREAFAISHDRGTQPYDRIILEGAGYSMEAITMDHRTPTLAYVVREKPRRNIDTSRLASLGLRPGAWLKELKDSANSSDSVVVDGVARSKEELRKELLVETPGDSIAYLTDFVLDEPAIERLTDALRGCRVMVCEGQYRHSDLDLARKHFHMTTVLSATVAKRARVEELILFHVSCRYESSEWVEMLREASQVFPNVHYPPEWNLKL
ncbi:ribonuclease Z [Chthoniobacter flavus Ellin428]|uniref:Ribonuclease Z n=1 Tax=Chthoniobacter flavus Ellin428 TaxID=497964 RepID=B4D381_9BACT|nr:MBL fold metallo-hydrolase [Chthoniobacter flavus]EDY19192.1 ribonuclease Z [Chthoniobacter flavus Ellin428]TCO88037.1 ribonuclease Z [Chthoniobacter flavus]